ncbi:ATP-binding cassette protein subfamily A, member 2 [Trypanosoma conorhini]|uniref:ATP-binding cassette protein subfamily A, member 2 n=1 Tax=Trypanosoma conorhini TaxID=83891 RepID=A0A422N456_9TRYP|nr:ATP-binding cassette protein subfamily A, member 2 [Trypanosoma conorhini]RNF00257.1 ATP-binding cassette protein subfamily A, member 2 [Trypanosoma conorhini]
MVFRHRGVSCEAAGFCALNQVSLLKLRLGRRDAATVAAVELFFEEYFHGSLLVEHRADRMIYSLPRDTRLSVAFDLLENHFRSLGLTDYHVSQTSIEQVFLRISEEAERAREEEAQRATEADKCVCCPCC